MKTPKCIFCMLYKIFTNCIIILYSILRIYIYMLFILNKLLVILNLSLI